MAFLGQEAQVRELQDRFRILYAVVFVGMLTLTGRLVYLQIFKGDHMKQIAEENRIKRVKVPAPRGMIFDRNRKLLIDNRPAFDLEIIPQYLKESKQTEEVISLLSKIIRMPVEEIRSTLEKAKNQASYLSVKIKTDLTRDEIAEIESWRIAMPGVSVAMEIKRTNVYGDVASHLLGYIGEVNNSELPLLAKEGKKYKLGDRIGKFGLEQKHEDELRGQDGEELVEVDALGRRKIAREKRMVLSDFSERKEVPGRNLILTIDQDLQLAAAKAFGEKNGSLVAIDPRTGEILAMISRPSFDPTEFSRGIPAALWNELRNNESKPLVDKTIHEHYPPGSTFKVITAIAGLEEGVIDENTKFSCRGWIKIGNRVVHCHKKHGHGEMNVVSALTQSCDVFFYRVAQKLRSVDDLAKWAFHMGLGRRTGIELAREVPGLIPTEEWKRKRFHEPWTPGETVNAAIGQGYTLATTLQLANMFATISNGGTLYQPFIVKSIESYDGQALETYEPKLMGRTQLSEKTYELVKQGLWGVVNGPNGTAGLSRLPGMDFSGKTGTAQVKRFTADRIFEKCVNLKYKDRHHGIFAGFAPAKNPVIAVAVIAEHACSGSGGAAPIAKEVVKAYLLKTFPDLYGPKTLASAKQQQQRSLPPQLPPPAPPVQTEEDVGVGAEENESPSSSPRDGEAGGGGSEP